MDTDRSAGVLCGPLFVFLLLTCPRFWSETWPMNRIVYRRRVRAMRVECLSGACWITWRGSGDVTLPAGQAMEVRGARDFCLEVMRGGEARIEEGRARPEAARQGSAPSACAGAESTP